MNALFSILRGGVLGFLLLSLAFVLVYVPQDWNQIKTTHAGGPAGGSLEVTQLANNAELISVNAYESISAAANNITAFATDSLWVKEYTLDGIAWMLAKSLISTMVGSLVDWINSGFAGSPTFVQDLDRFLTDAADQAVNQFLNNLGGSNSPLCSPFKLNIQIALAEEYQQQRDRLKQPTPKCNPTGSMDNLEDFLSGAQGSFDTGGWDYWFDVTSQPDVYTEYGAYGAARQAQHYAIINAKQNSLEVAKFGSGFLSGKICEAVSGPNGTEEECFISKPGKIIQEALTFNLDSGRQSLIAADEFDEVVAALLEQISTEALTGAAGLLGLSGGTGYTYTGFDSGSFTDQLVTDSFSSLGSDFVTTMEDSLQTQKDYYDLAAFYKPQLQNYVGDATTMTVAQNAATDARNIMIATAANIVQLTKLINDYNDPSLTSEEQSQIIVDYSSLRLFQESDIEASEKTWLAILN